MQRLGFIVALMLSACVVGDASLPGPGEEALGPDGGGGGGGGGDGGGGGNVDCEPAATTLPDGHHNPGTACLSCHNGQTASLFGLAGTVFTAANGATPVAGATVIVTDANGVTSRITTAANGNFFTGQQLTPPFTVSASKCPDTQVMPGMAAVGECNSCHQPGQAGRIHLP